MQAARPRSVLSRALKGLWGSRWAVFGVIALVVYPRFSSDFDQFVLASALTLALLAVTVDLQWGYTGILNLGPAASFGIGAYAYTVTQREIESFDPTYVAFGLAAFFSVLIGVGVAYAAFRAGTIPIYFALITLGLALVFERWISVNNDLGSINGLINIPRPDFHIPVLTDYRITTVNDFYPFVVGVVVACYLISLAVTSSSFGRVLRAIKADEEKAQTLGYNTLAHKLVIVGVASAIGGLAGAIYAPLTGIAHPSLFGFLISVQAFVWVAVGGQGTLIGPLVAGVILTLAREELRGVSSDAYVMIIAAMFILAVLFLPEGLAGLLARGGARVRLLNALPLGLREWLGVHEGGALVR